MSNQMPLPLMVHLFPELQSPVHHVSVECSLASDITAFSGLSHSWLVFVIHLIWAVFGSHVPGDHLQAIWWKRVMPMMF